MHDRGELDVRHLRRALPDPPAAARSARAACRGRAGPADRRARPHRRAVRGLSARGAVRLPGDDSRARHDQGGADADRDHHLQPHARDPRRAEAPLLLSLGRLSRPASASSRSSRSRRRASSERLSRQVVGFVQELRKLDLFKAPGVAETIDWATALSELEHARPRSQDDQRHAGRAAEVPGRHPAPAGLGSGRDPAQGEGRHRGPAAGVAQRRSSRPSEAKRSERVGAMSAIAELGREERS